MFLIVETNHGLSEGLPDPLSPLLSDIILFKCMLHNTNIHTHKFLISFQSYISTVKVFF